MGRAGLLPWVAAAGAVAAGFIIMFRSSRRSTSSDVRTSAASVVAQQPPPDDWAARQQRQQLMKQEVLRRLPLFAECSDDLISRLARQLQFDTLSAGEDFCVQGDYGDSMFIVVSGKAEVLVDCRRTAIFRENDFFGEIAVIEGVVRTATVKAMAPCEFFSLSRDAILEAIAEHPQLRSTLRRYIVQRKIQRKYTLAEQQKPEVRRQFDLEVLAEIARLEGTSRTTIQWKKNKRIGSGGFGEVFSAIDVRTGEPLAVKIISTSRLSERAIVALQAESLIMERLRHPHVVRGYGMQQLDDCIVLIMELVPLGSLQKLIQDFGPASEVAARSYATQMLQGLHYLHSEGVLHRDIKPANALISADGSIKLADFGISRLGLTHETVTISGTPAYLSPEAIGGRYSVSSDMWALGCTLLEMVTGEAPWSHLALESVTQLVFAVGSSTEAHPLPDYLTPSLRDLLSTLLAIDPARRLDASAALAHPWFTCDGRSLPSESRSPTANRVASDGGGYSVPTLCGWTMSCGTMSDASHGASSAAAIASTATISEASL